HLQLNLLKPLELLLIQDFLQGIALVPSKLQEPAPIFERARTAVEKLDPPALERIIKNVQLVVLCLADLELSLLQVFLHVPSPGQANQINSLNGGQLLEQAAHAVIALL